MSEEPKRHFPAMPGQQLPAPLLSVPSLKKRVEQIAFAKYDVDTFLNKTTVSAQERMRTLDLFNLHTPHPEEECKPFNLPSNRLHLHSMKDIMFLCGGLVGNRFTGEELKLVTNLTQTLVRKWNEIDGLYKSMTANDRKFVLKTPSYDSGDSVPPIIPVPPEIVTNFHISCDNYLVEMKGLQELIRKKQAEVDTSDASNGKEFSKMDADPESRMGSQYPVWFTVLKEKYNSYLEAHKAEKDIPKFTLGKFSVFLSSCVHGPITCTPQELDALSELSEASADNTSIFKADSPVISAQGSTTMTDAQRKYWSYRFFNFLKSVPELKTVIKDDKAVENMTFW